MKATASEIQNASRAGLILSGPREDGTLEWIGTDKQWTVFRTFMFFGEMYENHL